MSSGKYIHKPRMSYNTGILVNKQSRCSVHPLISPKILLLCCVVNRYHPPPPFISASETSYSFVIQALPLDLTTI
ncbi:hypothetical protein P8452_28200 [Trifolium repens]|nr:hypothetical protein P8452_28200 [Trifolium repens]